MAPVNLLEVEQLAIDFGGVNAVDHVSFVVDKPQVFSIIGPNGAGRPRYSMCFRDFIGQAAGVCVCAVRM